MKNILKLLGISLLVFGLLVNMAGCDDVEPPKQEEIPGEPDEKPDKPEDKPDKPEDKPGEPEDPDKPDEKPGEPDDDVPALPSSFQTISSEELVSGVYHYEASYGGIAMDILKVDLTDPTIKIDLGTGQIPGETKTVKQHCIDNSYAGHRVVGAINNDFFTNGSDTNFGVINFSPCIKDGMFIAPSWGGYAALAFDSGNTPLIYQTLKTWLATYAYACITSAEGKAIDIKQFNVKNPDWSDHVSIIYNKFFSGTLPSHKGTLYVTISLTAGAVVNGDTFGQVISKQWDTAPAVPEEGNCFVVAFTNSAARQADAAFADGGQVTINQFLYGDKYSQPLSGITTAWGGVPRIVTAGKVDNVSISRCPEPGTSNRPRSAAGYTADEKYLYLLATEGESTTVTEAADIMLALGCSEAINCDGGGSTQMVTSTDGINFNNVSGGNNGGSYRSVINAALIVSTAL